MRMSIASCMVTPMPTAGPFTAAMTGFRHSKIASVSRPPPSRMRSSLQSISVAAARLAVRPVRARVVVERGRARRQIGAGAERAARARHHDGAHVVVACSRA